MLYFRLVLAKLTFMELVQNLFTRNKELKQGEEVYIIPEINILNQKFKYPFDYTSYDIDEEEWEMGSACVVIPESTSLEEYVSKTSIKGMNIQTNESSREGSIYNGSKLTLDLNSTNFPNGYAVELKVKADAEVSNDVMESMLQKTYYKLITYAVSHDCSVLLVPKFKLGTHNTDYANVLRSVVDYINVDKKRSGNTRDHMLRINVYD
ncbi:hypothetical protein H312_02472 [Anncaliia algerae PRA339]|uniref:Uncharacterized protein n=1 Tax=Anncaliia algerae PRA339 TaxID=1288291 RepID=A0A059EZ07_9MICR|nr:hypothetical protein H312_02472 [Anncaliia algerae PRA339]